MRWFCVFILFVCGVTSLFSQDLPTQDNNKAFLSNSYTEFDKERVRSILNDFLASINKLKDSKGVVIVRGPLDEVIERKLLVVRHIYDKDFDNLRIRFKIVISDTEKKTEFWIVPHGAEEPKSDQKAWVGLELGDLNDKDTQKQIKEFFDKVFCLREELEFIVFNYGSREFIANRERILRYNLERVPEFPDPRVTLVTGGELRGNSTIIWLVPFGAELPQP